MTSLHLPHNAGELPPVTWEDDSWDRFTEVGMTLTGTNTYERTTPADGSNGVQVGQIEHTAGAQGNDRRCFVLPDLARDDRLLTTWGSAPLWAAGGSQMGQIHRVRRDPDGWMRAWMVFHDFVFGQTALINLYVIRWVPGGLLSTFHTTGIGGGTLSGVQAMVTATDASRTSNVVTATVAEGHGIEVGHQVTATFPSDTSYNGTRAVTAVTDTSVSWAQTAADDASAGAGTLNNMDGVLPLTVESEVVGSTVRARAWRSDQPVPSWSDPGHACQGTDTAGADPYPNRPGRSGLYVGHLDSSGVQTFHALQRYRYR